MDIKQRLQEIAARMSAIDTELNDPNANLEALDAESQKLVSERANLQVQLANQIRSGFAGGTLVVPTNVDPKQDEQRTTELSKLSKRDKTAYVIGKTARNKQFTDAEKRALGSALTTTATTYVAATADVNGVNNAGVLIPTNLVLDLLREEGKLSPILADINFTSIPGLTDFPYRKSRDKAKAKAEGAEGKDNQMEWAKLSLVKGYLQTIIPVTDEILALSDFNFGEYIISQILQDINEDWVGELIYGTGADDRIKGITIGATDAVTGGYDTASGGPLKAIIDGLKKLTGKFRRGAKIYVAQDVYDEIFFAVDDNGNFKYPVFNNSQGITSLGPVRVELDENLTAGHFLIGNVNKWFKANSLIPLRLETDRLARKGVTEWIASEYCATSPLAITGSVIFVKGAKKA